MNPKKRIQLRRLKARKERTSIKGPPFDDWTTYFRQEVGPIPSLVPREWRLAIRHCNVATLPASPTEPLK